MAEQISTIDVWYENYNKRRGYDVIHGYYSEKGDDRENGGPGELSPAIGVCGTLVGDAIVRLFNRNKTKRKHIT